MDSVELEKKETVETGDIVLAKLGDGQYILHRVVGLVGDEVTLMGDGNIAGREHCRLNDVKGCVVRILHQNGTGTECTDKRYLRRVRMWKILLPFRRYILAIYKRVI